MIYKAFSYQEYCTRQIIALPEVGPFLDMGLGKTVSTLNAIVELYKTKQIKKVLVIAPKKVAETVWTDEIEKWDHLNGLKTSKILGSEKDRKRALMQQADIYLINRENVVWLVAMYGSNWPFDMVVIDELSSFKNPKSQRFKSLRLVRKFMARVVGLTGTPAPNGLLDLWSQIFLLDKGQRLGENFTKYRDTYFNPGKKDGYVVFNYNLKKGDFILGEDFYKKEIFDRIGDICFSMKTEDYLQLPEKIDNDQIIILPKEIQKKYDDFEEEQVLAFADKEITAVNAAALTNKLLQFANGAVYDENKMWHVMHDEKLDKLKEIVEVLEGKPLLVFYSFISDKERILLSFKKARVLKTPQDIKDWNAGKIEILVAHPTSAGHGLNLQFGGNNILWYGCPWSLEQYLQGIKRVHRNGVVGIVNNMRLIIKNTMDEDVVKALEGKDKLQDAVIKAVKARIEKYGKAKK
jgi:SNF2 family DNA or RNA helicase